MHYIYIYIYTYTYMHTHIIIVRDLFDPCEDFVSMREVRRWMSDFDLLLLLLLLLVLSLLLLLVYTGRECWINDDTAKGGGANPPYNPCRALWLKSELVV